MSRTQGQIVAVSTSLRRGVPKDNVLCVTLIAGQGIAGDIHAGTGHRQVSLLALESIQKMRRLGATVEPGSMAENITTLGVDISSLAAGDRLLVGETELVVTQVGKECHRRCAIFDAVGDCVMPREGVFARVVTGGTVRPGDGIMVTRRVVAPESYTEQKRVPPYPKE